MGYQFTLAVKSKTKPLERRDEEMSGEPIGFAQLYPNISAWVSSDGWIEIGNNEPSPCILRALDEGGLVWQDNNKDVTLGEALQALDTFLEMHMSQYG